MLILLSPAKSLDLNPIEQSVHSIPALKSDVYKLSKTLKKLDTTDLQKLMNISETLATENVMRFKNFRNTHHERNSKRAIDTFMGDVYRGLGSKDFSKSDYEYAQSHLRILSGLYGVLRPLDLIQPYRLEMGTSLTNERGSNLYQFWGSKPTYQINKALKESGSRLIINLASDEYFKVIERKKLKGDVLKIGFKEYRDGKLKFLSFNAKIARGLMARFIIKNKLQSKEEIKAFDIDGYSFDPAYSDEMSWVFTR